MPSHVPMYLSPQAQPTVRTPKLRFRNHTSDVDSVSTATTNLSNVSISTNPTSPAQSDVCLSPKDPPSDTTCSSPRAPSIAGSPASPQSPGKPFFKKRQNFLSGLFTVKEPSAQALASYQKQMVKRGTVKDGRINAVGMAGVSSATLPPEVPKVNSKWDGVPRSLKEKDKKKGMDRQSSTLTGSRNTSTASSGISSEGGSLRTSRSGRPPSRGTLDGASTCTTNSGGSRNHLAELYGWEVTDFAERGSAWNLATKRSRPGTSKSTSSKSAGTGLSSVPASSDVHLPPRRPNTYFDRPLPSPTASPYPPTQSNSPSLTPHDVSPVTPDEPSAMTSVTSKASQNDPLKPHSDWQDGLLTMTIKAPANVDEVIIRSSGVNILAPPLSAKRAYRPLPGRNPDQDRPQTSAGSTSMQSILKEATQTLQRDSPISSIVSSPGSPNKIQRRERLGVGFHVRNHDVAPWESPELAHGKTSERTITPTPESGGHSLRRKRRMSLFEK